MEEPRKRLILLNCRLNNVTVIDIGKKSENKYCHLEASYNYSELDSNHTPLIKVEDVTEEKYQKKLGKFVVYEHAVDPYVSRQRTHLGSKFHISGFKNGDTDLQFKKDDPIPVLNVTKFLVYYCDKGTPLLFYLKCTKEPDGEQPTEAWYKKPPDEDGARETDVSWIKVSGGEVPKHDRDTDAIWDIINSYRTPCQSLTRFYVITGGSVLAGGAGTAGLGYGIYEAVNWLTRPWWRLM